jgi:hypothetical protein
MRVSVCELLAALIERCARAAQALKRAQVISPWVFCFEAPVRARSKNRRLDHRAGEPLFQERAASTACSRYCITRGETHAASQGIRACAFMISGAQRPAKWSAPVFRVVWR